jgi:hypothetical protein
MTAPLQPGNDYMTKITESATAANGSANNYR